MKVSFIVPAFNEAKYIEDCLRHIDTAVKRCQAAQPQRFEVERIVVDNNSTDDTAVRANVAGARVVFEPINQISRARNAGAKAATGDWLIFIDADSDMSSGLLVDVLGLIEGDEHIGCGAVVEMSNVPRGWRASVKFWNWLSRKLSWVAGSFLACRADAFAELGGFSEELFVSEEIEFSRRAKRYAKRHGKKFVVLADHPLVTSGRKAQLYTNWEVFAQTCRLMLRPNRTRANRSELDVWYDGRR